MPVQFCAKCRCNLAFVEVSSNSGVCQRCKPDWDVEKRMQDEDHKKLKKEVETNLENIRKSCL